MKVIVIAIVVMAVGKVPIDLEKIFDELKIIGRI